MTYKTIYSKVYPKFDIEAFAKQAEEEERNNPESKEVNGEIVQKYVYVYMPQREQLKEIFIKQAIECSEDYEVDLELIDTSTSIVAHFSFDYGPLYEFMKGVLMFADEVDFDKGLNGKDVSAILTFRTHKVVYEP